MPVKLPLFKILAVHQSLRLVFWFCVCVWSFYKKKKKYLFFNWRIIGLQNCLFLQNSMNQPKVYIFPLPSEPPSYLPPCPTILGCCRGLVWVPWVIWKCPLAIYFTYGYVSFHVTVSIHSTLSFLYTHPLQSTVSIILFSMSVSPLLPCKLFHQYHLAQFSHSVMSDSLQPNGLQDDRPPCPSPTSRVYSNSCPLSQWYHPTI